MTSSITEPSPGTAHDAAGRDPRLVPDGAATPLGSVTDGREVEWMIRLALGDAASPPALDWRSVWELSLRERVAMLSWLRSGSLIRRAAPAGIAAAWRSHAFVAAAHERRQRETIVEAVELLERGGLAPIVLKGIPLAMLAYGHASTRVSTDVDLFVAAEGRVHAKRLLESVGWRARTGRPPWDETFERERDGQREFLELHSRLVHDTLSHIELPVQHLGQVELPERVVSTLTGPLLPVYLAAHAAVHEHPPMLWFLDIAALWETMGAEDRAGATRIASAARLERYLAWALEWAAAVLAAGRGDDSAISSLGFARDGSRHDSTFVRALRLPRPGRDSARVAAAWIWPRPLRTELAGSLRLFGGRLARRAGLTALFRAREAVDHASARRSRALGVSPDELVPLVRQVVDGGGSLWIRVHGGSMEPAVPRGAQVRLCPLPERSLGAGDVVFAVTPTSIPVVHRVESIEESTIRLRGDALPEADSPLSPDRVLAIADRVRIGHAEFAMPARRGRPWRRIGYAWRNRLLRRPTSLT